MTILDKLDLLQQTCWKTTFASSSVTLEGQSKIVLLPCKNVKKCEDITPLHRNVYLDTSLERSRHIEVKRFTDVTYSLLECPNSHDCKNQGDLNSPKMNTLLLLSCVSLANTVYCLSFRDS